MHVHVYFSRSIFSFFLSVFAVVFVVTIDNHSYSTGIVARCINTFIIYIPMKYQN